jgi:hypothetical protein
LYRYDYGDFVMCCIPGACIIELRGSAAFVYQATAIEKKPVRGRRRAAICLR